MALMLSLVKGGGSLGGVLRGAFFSHGEMLRGELTLVEPGIISETHGGIILASECLAGASLGGI